MAETYKSDQGKLVRRLSFWGLAALILWGSYTLTNWFVAKGFEALNKPLLGGDAYEDALEVPLLAQKLTIGFAVAWGLGLFALYLLHRWLNRPKNADFLISTDDELSKVTWPSRKDAWNSSLIVMGFVVILMAFLFGVDLVLKQVFDLIMGSRDSA